MESEMEDTKRHIHANRKKVAKSGQAAECRKKWKYMEVMSFLDAYLEESG